MVGQTIGKYRVESRIGRGGMGTVYRAVDETLHREVAIKVLNSELNDPEVARRFRAEAITVARLSHPGIATIYELFEHDGQWLMVMEFVKGETLERLVERAGPLSAERAADLTMQALAALGHAHALGVVHRDLKPANLMLTESGAVKIMDFGIARVSGSEHLTNVGFMMGTPAYMAPEQVLSQEVDSRADLYAIGVVIYRLTTGRLPFKGETPFALAQSQVNDPPTPIRLARQGLPEWLEQVITVALAKSPGDRFQSAQDFYTTLQRCLAGLPMTMPPDVSAPTGMMLTPPGLPTGVLGPQTPFGTKLPTGTIATGTTGTQRRATDAWEAVDRRGGGRARHGRRARSLAGLAVRRHARVVRDADAAAFDRGHRGRHGRAARARARRTRDRRQSIAPTGASPAPPRKKSSVLPQRSWPVSRPLVVIGAGRRSVVVVASRSRRSAAPDRRRAAARGAARPGSAPISAAPAPPDAGVRRRAASRQRCRRLASDAGRSGRRARRPAASTPATPGAASRRGLRRL